MMRTAWFTRLFVFDIGRCLQGVGALPHALAGRRDLLLGNCHLILRYRVHNTRNSPRSDFISKPRESCRFERFDESTGAYHCAVVTITPAVLIGTFAKLDQSQTICRHHVTQSWRSPLTSAVGMTAANPP
jgi:hypothetical protein